LIVYSHGRAGVKNFVQFQSAESGAGCMDRQLQEIGNSDTLHDEKNRRDYSLLLSYPRRFRGCPR